MSLIADGLLLAAALAAIFYCWAVNRRIAGLQKQSSALTERLAHLDVTVAEVRTIIAEGRNLAEQERDRLGGLVQNADRLHHDMQKAAAMIERATKDAKPPTQPEPEKRQSSLERVKRFNRAQKLREVS